MQIKELWNCACNGNIKKLKRYYKSGGTKNLRYRAFRTEHSLIAGAYRNKQHDTVNFLLSIGETITLAEAEEFRDYLNKFGKGENYGTNYSRHD